MHWVIIPNRGLPSDACWSSAISEPGFEFLIEWEIKFTIFVYISTRLSLEIYFPIRNKILDIIRTEIKSFLNNNLWKILLLELFLFCKVQLFYIFIIILTFIWMESVVIRKLCYNKLNYAKNYIWKYCKKRPLLFK